MLKQSKAYDNLKLKLKHIFFLQMGKNRLFQESFQKNPPEVTPIIYMKSNRQYVEKLCAKGDK
jgi:hypothetical protein